MIYLISPYMNSDPKIREKRFHLACNACYFMRKNDLFVYSPIVHWHPVATFHDLPKDFRYWERHDHHMISLCREAWVLTIDGWSLSKGVANDIHHARSLKKPVSYVTLKEIESCRKMSKERGF